MLPTRPRAASPHVVHPLVVQPETVGAVGPVDQQLQILPDAESKRRTGGRARTRPGTAAPAPPTPLPATHTLPLLPRALLLFCYLLKHYTRLLFSQRPHFPAELVRRTLVPQLPETEDQPPAAPWQPQSLPL